MPVISGQFNMNAKDIFLKAIEIDSAEERRAFMDRECDGDVQLRRRVEALLAAHDDPESYLDRPAAKFDVAETTDSSGPGLSDSSSHHGRFLPGTRVDNRYRIVSLLGRGGMGEVYRADDLRLGQSVALKFLPPELAKDDKRLEYFHNEVRLTRQVSHPNVCRTYDIGEVDGQHFISMEYIDGEDLQALLKRIGRLPGDKGIEIAQQLCAGLAAAHGKGVLHRDLKPANIMIDGQGQVRITDFGLAAGAVDGEQTIGMSGTPAYMAPEQLLRGQTSVQSDLYSLGLILYELTVGRPAHEAASLAALRRLHEESSRPRGASDLVDVDPAVDRAISWCLEPEPANRPKSVVALMAVLPGADPLAAALAMGYTPSPEMVAAAGETGAISVRRGLLLLAIIIIYLVIEVYQGPGPWSKDHVIPDEVWNQAKEPAVLRERARECLHEFQYDESKHHAEGNLDIASVPHYWYRQTDQPFSPLDGRGVVGVYDPAPRSPGMILVVLDYFGHLVRFEALTRSESEESDDIAELDFAAVFELAGLEIDDFTETTPTYQFPVGTQTRYGWISSREPSANSATTTRIELGTVGGQLVYFGSGVNQMDDVYSAQLNEPTSFLWYTSLVIRLVGLLGCIPFAFQNLSRRRADVRGATRLGTVALVLALAASLLICKHLGNDAFLTLFRIAAEGLLFAIFFGFMYLAVEPHLRRAWPNLLVSWSRLLAAKLTDPLVGRDILTGFVVALLFALSAHLLNLALPRELLLPPPPRSQWVTFSIQDGLSNMSRGLLMCFGATLHFVLLLVIVLAIVRRRAPTVLLFAVVLGLIHMAIIWGRVNVYTPVFVLSVCICLFRYGLLSLATFVTVSGIVALATPSLQNPDWMSNWAWFSLSLLIAVALFATWIATKGLKHGLSPPSLD